LLEDTKEEDLVHSNTFYEFNSQTGELLVQIKAFRIVTFLLSQEP